jgi:hypothetical protein
MMDGFASQLDQQLGRRLYEWNKDSFPGLDRRPRIRFKHIDKEPELVQMGQFFRSMDGILPLGDDDMKAIRDKTGFLPKNLPVDPLPPASAAPGSVSAFPPTNPGQKPMKDGGPVVKEPGGNLTVEEAMAVLEDLAKDNNPKVYDMFLQEG